MNKRETLKLFHYLDSYYNKKFQYPKKTKEKSKMMVETWHDFLCDYEYQVVSAATKKLISRKEWPPTPGEIIQEIEDMRRSAEDKLMAEEALQLVLKAIRKHGVQFPDRLKKIRSEVPDKALKAAELVGGLNKIAMTPDSKLGYLENRYKKVYEGLTERQEQELSLPPSQREEVKQLSRSMKGETPKLEEGE